MRQAAPFWGLGISLVATREDVTRARRLDEPSDLPRIPERQQPGQARQGSLGGMEAEGLLLLASYFQPSSSTWPCISDGQC